MKLLLAPLLILSSLPACTQAREQPALRSPMPAGAVPATWPEGAAFARPSVTDAPKLGWQDVFGDDRLRRLISQALASNRDLRVAAANVARARAQVQQRRAVQRPQIGAGADASRSDSGNGPAATRISTDLGTTDFEIDLFGRLSAMTLAEQNRDLASEAASRAVRLALVSDIAEIWLTHGADASLLQIARETEANAARSVTLTRARLTGGVAPRTDLRQAEQVQATAATDIARQELALAQDVNLLQLLVGAPVDPALLPRALDDAAANLRELPAGLSSDILLQRPDIIQAEYLLLAADADVKAARAALLPRISLTGLLGLASGNLSSLFANGAWVAQAGGSITYPIFSGGAGKASVRISQAQRDAALASYEKAIQSGFREVADALARRGTIDDQVDATRRLLAASDDNLRLSEARYKGGVDSFLAVLDAQRTSYAARRTLTNTGLDRALNLVALYRSLGGELPAMPL